MKSIEIILIAVIVLGAAFYLGRTFCSKKKNKSCCCSGAGCKVSNQPADKN